ncbi:MULTISPECIES: hypothetical protein [unclassified Chelatococcus]|uniref:hypothetical protein n=1 Tax=unclassified Chelatococcus TaxID=2638111 RepID=UPI001BD18726|nr:MULTISPECIES: hypothetical protein [unclassified Chelatococcus]MBS7701181.1 hypothetical protein [Chelatococcus sp. YT9]MBX3557312.1 hypothetical protein [Chelatococcus sp.]
MANKAYGDFIEDLGEFLSQKRYDMNGAGSRLGQFHLDELSLRQIGMIEEDEAPFDNEYSSWTGKYGIKCREEFLASPWAQHRAFEDSLEKNVYLLRHVLQYDGQIIDGQEISLSGMVAAASVTDAYKVFSYLGGDKSRGLYPETSDVKEALSRFHGYEIPYEVETRSALGSHVVGSDGPDIVRSRGDGFCFKAKGGNDIYYGGTGEDTIKLTGQLKDFTITPGLASASWDIKRQLDDGSEEHKHIDNVELIMFEDGKELAILDLREMPTDVSAEKLPLLMRLALWDLTPVAVDFPAVDSSPVEWVAVGETNQPGAAPDF